MRHVLPMCLLSLSIQPGCHEPTLVTNPNHTADTPVGSGTALAWHDVSASELSQVIPPGSYGIPFSDDNPLVARLQNWVTEFDSVVRDRRSPPHPPRPRVVITSSQEQNALVPQATLCIPIAIRVPGIDATPRGGAIGISAQGRIAPHRLPCLEINASTERVAEGLARAKKLAPACVAALDEGTLEISPDCIAPAARKSVAEATHLALPAAANLIVVHRGLFEYLKSEEEVMFLLMHELGHYYLAHAALTQEESRYFYLQQVPPSAGRPPLDPALQQRGSRFLSLRTLPVSPAIAGMHWHVSAFNSFVPFGPFRRQVDSTCAAGCTEACSSFREQSKNSAEIVRNVMRGYPPSGLALAAYHELENAARACLASIRVADSDMTRLLDDISAENRRAHPLLPDGAKLLAHEPATLADVVDALSHELRQLERERNELNRWAVESRLGIYTSEQEADDFALEALSLLGTDARAGERTLARLVASLRGTLSSNATREDFSPEVCISAYENGWRDPMGTPVFVPQGSWESAYHGDCYRLFNLSREIAAHAYPPGDTQRLLSPQEWADLLATAL